MTAGMVVAIGEQVVNAHPPHIAERQRGRAGAWESLDDLVGAGEDREWERQPE
jgi:hypothetical protein